jgi:VIT family
MRLLAIERKHIAPVPSGEREEARQIFGLKGFSGGELERIVDVIMSDEDRWAQTMAVEEFRLSLIVKSPILAALSTSAAFLLCGLVPFVSWGWTRSGLETLLIGMSAARETSSAGEDFPTLCILGIGELGEPPAPSIVAKHASTIPETTAWPGICPCSDSGFPCTVKWEDHAKSNAKTEGSRSHWPRTHRGCATDSRRQLAHH